MSKQGWLVVISAPSGGGKNTVIHRILSLRPDYKYSISTTTRPKRPYESNGEHYLFIDRESFRRKIENGEFIEWAEVHGELYGTDRKLLDETILSGGVVLLDLDVNGGEAILKNYPHNTLAIFLHAPSIEELRRRLLQRGSETEESIAKRLSRYEMEVERGKNYPYQIVNDQLDSTVSQVLNIIDTAERI